jgi:hypothetical protein
MSAEVHSTIVFVCPHVALKSKLAAAFFNQTPPIGWPARSAGLRPQEHVSVHATPILSGTATASFLGTQPRGRWHQPWAITRSTVGFLERSSGDWLAMNQVRPWVRRYLDWSNKQLVELIAVTPWAAPPAAICR